MIHFIVLLRASRNPIERSDSTRVIISNRDSIDLAIARYKGLKIMQEAAVSGTVLIKIFVNSQGHNIRNQEEESPHLIVIQTILEFVPFMRFEIEQGKNYQQDSEYTVEFKFK